MGTRNKAGGEYPSSASGRPPLPDKGGPEEVRKNTVRLDLGTPNAKQAQAIRDRHRYLAYGGARGGGKSWFVRVMAILYCLLFSDIKVLITRRTYPELENNHIGPLKEILHGAAVYNEVKKRFTFPNGSTIQFGYCNSGKDLGQYQGAEYDIWFADEAGQFEQSWLEKIDACVRGANPFPKRTIFTLNPGGPSHGYFKRLFIDKRYKDGEHPEDFAFIQALVTDNKALMESQPNYVRALEKLPPKLRKAWLEGSWEIYEGQFFEDFIPNPMESIAEELGTTTEQLRQEHRWCHVVRPFAPPAGWTYYRSYDWGYGKPFSFGWWAVDYDGVLYRILELYGCTKTPNEGVKWTVEKQMAEAARIEREHPWLKGKEIQGVADPSIWEGSKGESVAETASRYGLYFKPGVNDRIPGWMQVHYRLSFDDNGYARMYVFENCRAFIRTIPLLMYDEHKVEDLDTDGEDHVADEVRYMCMARPVKPVLNANEEPVWFDPLDQVKPQRYGKTQIFGR